MRCAGEGCAPLLAIGGFDSAEVVGWKRAFVGAARLPSALADRVDAAVMAPAEQELVAGDGDAQLAEDAGLIFGGHIGAGEVVIELGLIDEMGAAPRRQRAHRGGALGFGLGGAEGLDEIVDPTARSAGRRGSDALRGGIGLWVECHRGLLGRPAALRLIAGCAQLGRLCHRRQATGAEQVGVARLVRSLSGGSVGATTRGVVLGLVQPVHVGFSRVMVMEQDRSGLTEREARVNPGNARAERLMARRVRG